MSAIDKILSLLNEKGKTQKELTDYLGISKNAFTDWKSGRIKSYTKYLSKIAEFLGVSVDYLLGNNDITQSVFGILSDDEQQLLTLFRKLPDENQLQVIGYIQGVVATLSNEKNNDTIETA